MNKRMKKQSGRLRSFFKKEPLDCDYVYKILGDTIGLIDPEKHVTSLVQHQEKLDGDMGAWSEFFSFSRGNEAPLATAEAILAIIDFAQRSDVNNAIKRACKFLIQCQNDGGGWKDLSNYSLNDATGGVIAALSAVAKRNVQKIPERTLQSAIDFLVSQQNEDGGWATVKGEKSKMHYTFFALFGLSYCKDITATKGKVNRSVKKGILWIEENSAKNNDKGISISLDDAPSPVATALAILSYLNIGKPNRIKQQWVDFIKASRRNGDWNEISDVSLVHGVRRVYHFRSVPWILEALVKTGELLDSEIIRSALRELKKYELPNGGFVSDVGQAGPVVWHTCWSIRMMQCLRNELIANLRLYVDNSIKNAMELTRKVENYEEELDPEKKIMKVFMAFTLILASITTYLLNLVTSASHGKLIWYPFAVVSSAIITVSVAYYWYKRRKLNKFTALFLSILFSAINILLGLIA